jgi:uncharacterized protein (TIGR02145 family)
MKKSFRITLASIAFALAFTLSACGGDDGDGNTKESCPTLVDGSNAQACPNAVTDKSGKTVTCGSKTYKTTVIGNQTWMAENLNYEAEGSVCYDKKPENCVKYGRLYNWETAMKVCPDGWHLPSVEEWDKLIDFVGGKDIAGTKLKAQSGWSENNGTDDYGFSALPGSSGFPNCRFSSNAGGDGKWWSSDENTNNSPSSDAYTKAMSDFFGATVADGNSDKPNLLSVRCVEDTAP